LRWTFNESILTAADILKWYEKMIMRGETELMRVSSGRTEEN